MRKLQEENYMKKKKWCDGIKEIEFRYECALINSFIFLWRFCKQQQEKREE